MMQALRRNALRMVRGSGAGTVTHYNAGVIEEAKENGVAILVAETDKRTGKVRIVARWPRMVHRPKLTAVFGDTHSQAGEGKYIALGAYPNGDASSKVVIGAQYVNPYLKANGCYATIVQVFQSSMIGLGKLRANICRTRSKSDHLIWEGRRNSDGFLVASEWLTPEEIWDTANKLNPSLQRVLRKSKSGRKDVTHRKSPKEKFFADLDVMRRATRVVDAATGEVIYSGGATPYAAPLEQSGFAIDRRYLSYGVDKDGVEQGRYYYRMVVGRPEPHYLPKPSWAHEGFNSTVAFLNKAAQAKIRKAQSTAA